MGIILFDGAEQQTLLPLMFTRPVADLRIGILTIAEKWQKYLNQPISFLTQPYLQEKFPLTIADENLLINGSVCPDEALVDAVTYLQEGEVLKQNSFLIAAKVSSGDVKTWQAVIASFKAINYTPEFVRLVFPEDIFRLNETELRKDFAFLTKGKTSASISNTNTILGNAFFAEEGAAAECATFNTRLGPIYLSKTSEVFEGANIRGSFFLGECSQVKMGAKIYGATTVGPHCTIGGEVKNAVIWGYSSKGHEGYLGNSVLGEWCNIGADSNNSNLKNTYAEVKLWDYPTQKLRGTGLQFCGLIMADHAKCGINTMFNTGTVAGVNSNIFGAGYPQKFIPDFSWGGIEDTEIYAINKALETAKRVFERKNREFNETEANILKHIFELTTLNTSK
ncbi:putative sugar nucleotidyl transferase [Mucilaginibacter arboris]|uniref:Glucose-1-phosphate thymidylyltransferase n=1 Tax=Mucilaginibacter arboris TaxID=2682090 RepID=A0A7K1SYF1_9SPHI|nr:putative sugar nucleotidyl transferase [Mucilaginibacter arboris]MVN22341.1 glucose-1-phosphate thymidylyltransferase [Mucilaginibacter arboris]